MNPTFITVATFQYSSEAQIIKGRLESDGIEVFLADNYTIDTDPLVSNAIGGVKLKVHHSDEVEARAILESIATTSLDDEGVPMRCPKCERENVQLFTTVTDAKSLGAFLLGFLFGALPFYTRYQYRCGHCSHKFNEA